MGRRRRWSLLQVVLACLAAVVALAHGAASTCTSFTPTGCWFTRRSPEVRAWETTILPKCGTEPCSFEDTGELECPFFSSGTYEETAGDDCSDFMRVDETSRTHPACGKACCQGVVPGEWVSDAGDPAVRDYAPSSDVACSYTQIRRQDVLERLLGGSTDIVIAGDSMMRQLFVRLIQMLRGRHRVFDYRVHTHARYELCEEADAFRTAEYMSDMKQPGIKYLIGSISSFFAPATGNDSERAALGLAACSRPQAHVDFLHAPLFSYQSDILRKYMAAVPRPGRGLLVISYLGVWTKTGKVPGPYLALLEDISATALVVVLSVPTFREQRHPESCAKYEQRNAFMRSWADQMRRRVLFLDFDALSLAPNAPPTTRDWDKHYMCYTTYPRASSDPDLHEKLRGMNGLRERVFGNPVGDIWHTTDGECYDEMNRGLWVVLLNALLRTNEGGDWPAMPEPAARDGAWSVGQAGSTGSSSSEAGDEAAPPQQATESSGSEMSADTTAEPNLAATAVRGETDSHLDGTATDTGGTAAEETEQ